MAFENERDYLLELAELNDGVLTTEVVLENARQETSPLHRHFQWDDTIAAENYRRWQARSLIAKCRITIEPRTESTIRAFVSLPSDRGQEGGYRVTTTVLTDDDQRDELLADMRNRVTYWTRQASLLDPQTRQALNRFAEQIALPAQAEAA